MTLDDVDHIVCHQANQRILDASIRKLGVPAEKMFKNLDRYANTSAASIPLALAEMKESGKLFVNFDSDIAANQTYLGQMTAYGSGANVCIVESEKTALLMSIAYGNNLTQVWMACGGVENLSAEKLRPIMQAGRRIILYPDRDAIDKWKAKAENLHYDKVTVFTDPVLKWWREGDGDKADVADVVVRILNSHPETGSIADSPAIRTLIEKLNLEPIDNDR